MGVAQLASRSPHYLNSRMRPIFSFPAAPAAADASERRPYQRTNPVGARLRRDRSLRAVRTQRTPWKGVPTNTMPGSLSRSKSSRGSCNSPSHTTRRASYGTSRFPSTGYNERNQPLFSEPFVAHCLACLWSHRHPVPALAASRKKP